MITNEFVHAQNSVPITTLAARTNPHETSSVPTSAIEDPPPSLRTNFKKASLSVADIVDRFPAGFDNGLAKLAMSYKAVELIFRLEDGQSRKVDRVVKSMAKLGKKLEEYKERSDALKDGTWSRIKKATQGLASFVAESSAVLITTVAASVFTGGAGAVAASTSATYPQVFGSTLVHKMEEAGYKISDVEQIRDALDSKEFMVKTKRASHISAAQTTSAVFVGGLVAGYAYSIAAKPVEQAGASFVKDVFARFTVEASEGSAQAVGKGVASLAKSGVNAVGKKAIVSIPIQQFTMAAEANQEMQMVPANFSAHVTTYKKYAAAMHDMPYFVA